MTNIVINVDYVNFDKFKVVNNRGDIILLKLISTKVHFQCYFRINLINFPIRRAGNAGDALHWALSGVILVEKQNIFKKKNGSHISVSI